ncbi:MAG: prepilin-type N-terminal cleavage/methylation domain-containing protein [Pseudomonadota bacterium]|nr:prepilin-type N-terminal cleavage/methylation domain-containing protein [Pseudomonadota bacterium]
MFFKSLSHFKQTGFTLIELMISSALGLIIATFCLTSLHDFMFAEQFVDAQYRSVQRNSQVIESVSLMTEIGGFLPSESLSFTSSWNYGTGESNFDTGEIIKIDNEDKSNLISLRLMGDSYNDFRDCHGLSFGADTLVYINFSLNEQGEFSCRSRHYVSGNLVSDTDKVLVEYIKDIHVTAVLRDDTAKWKTLTDSNLSENPTYIKAVLLEVLSDSAQPAHAEAIKQSFHFFDGDVVYTSKNALVYQSKLLALTNQEHQSEY